MRKSNSESDIKSGPVLVILSGPSGAGKDAVIARMRELDCHLERIVTITTRPRRAGERDNIDYHFISPEAFGEMVKRGEFLEWATVYGNNYGVPRADVKEILDKEQDAIIKVDVQGAATLKKILPEAIFIFLIPPSMEELVTRLKKRDTESAQDLALRLKFADKEMKQLDLFDYVVVNRPGEVDRAVSDIRAIITAEKCRANPRRVTLRA